jgi:hypothetical protein
MPGIGNLTSGLGGLLGALTGFLPAGGFADWLGKAGAGAGIAGGALNMLFPENNNMQDAYNRNVGLLDQIMASAKDVSGRNYSLNSYETSADQAKRDALGSATGVMQAGFNNANAATGAQLSRAGLGGSVGAMNTPLNYANQAGVTGQAMTSIGNAYNQINNREYRYQPGASLLSGLYGAAGNVGGNLVTGANDQAKNDIVWDPYLFQQIGKYNTSIAKRDVLDAEGENDLSVERKNSLSSGIMGGIMGGANGANTRNVANLNQTQNMQIPVAPSNNIRQAQQNTQPANIENNQPMPADEFFAWVKNYQNKVKGLNSLSVQPYMGTGQYTPPDRGNPYMQQVPMPPVPQEEQSGGGGNDWWRNIIGGTAMSIPVASLIYYLTQLNKR